LSEYQRLCGVDRDGKPINKGEWIPYGSNPFEKIRSVDHTHYLSKFIYNDKHLEQYKKTNSVAGMEDVTTDTLYWDFDSKDNLEQAKSDTQEMCARLVAHGIPKETILVCFSGAKGFSVEVKSEVRLKPEEIRQIASKMAEGLTTFDGKIYDGQRIFRVPGTKHQSSGLYKTPLELDDLSCSMEDIKKAAAIKPDSTWIELKAQELPQSIIELKRNDTKDRATNNSIADAVDLDFKHKPKGFSNCKFALMNGFFEGGSRNHAMMVLASTCRANGYPKEIAYNICKASARLQAQRTNTEPFSKEEIWTQVIERVYGDNWNGGQYTCKTDHNLQKICEGLGRNKCRHDTENVIIPPDEVFDLFKNYALSYEKNVIHTGIPGLDDKAHFMLGTSNAILAAPGAGKTSISLSMLNHNSNKDISSIFFSYDMFHSMLYLRLVQRHFGLRQEQIFKIIKEDPVRTQLIRDTLKEQYKNVNFCFKTGQSPEEINQTIIDAEEKSGKKVRLVIVDYNELVVSEYSDPTQASAQVAQKLRQIANEREVALITLLQPSKLYSDISEEPTSYQAAKGSGAIAQSMTLMLSMSRPGFNPKNPEDDRFMTINSVKNRNGQVFSMDFSWDGLKGSIGELDHEDEDLLRQLRSKKELQKESGILG
jgi:KaiC/GvpD/RAD55 family RecA-like ATPase